MMESHPNNTEYAQIERLLFLLEKTGKPYDLEKVKKAYVYARKLHCGQFRESGEEYICHPIAVAEIVAGLELDTDSICAALLHDTVEDCNIEVSEIKSAFGSEVAMLVDGLTKLVRIPFDDKEEEHMENLRKMFLAMSKDIRVIFIKLCDRLHNMRTLSAKREEKQRINAVETMYVYAPLAHRLGMQRIKQELENLSLSYLDPFGYAEVNADIEKKYGANRGFIEKTRELVSARLTEESVHFMLEGRVKSVYSVYRKMYEQNKSFDEIYDFYALRVIVETELECYTTLGIIHDMFNSIPGRFKDYISTPKPNMYQSLHTTVIGKDGIPFEVQIRTKEMHRIAEYGVAAHWKYKSGDKGSDTVDHKLEWISKLVENEDYNTNPEEFLNMLKIDIFHDETFVFTPKGDVITLPQGATVIDFAYAIHSAVGNKMIGAKINGMIAPIDRIPQNGEIVEILTSSSSKGPSRDWLKIVRTSEARAKIRQWFKKEKRSENILMGRAEVEKEFKRFGRPYTDEQRDEILIKVAQRIGMHELEDLFNTIGYGGLAVSKLSAKLRDEFDRVVKPVQPEPVITDVKQIQTTPRVKKSTGGVIIDGVEGCQVKFAKCCNPLPGDRIIGFITKNYGVSIHKNDCPNVHAHYGEEQYRDRWVAASWDAPDATSEQGGLFEALIVIHSNDRIGLLADITCALADMRVSLIQVNTQKKENDSVLINLIVGCKNLDHFQSIISRLKSVQGIFNITRGHT